jgi:hypothetical protein
MGEVESQSSMVSIVVAFNFKASRFETSPQSNIDKH